MITKKWIYCPICRNKTRTKIRKDTELINYPLFCPKCKQESLINVRQQQITVIEQTLRRRADNTENKYFLGYRLILLVIKSGALFFRYFLRLDDSVSDAFHDN